MGTETHQPVAVDEAPRSDAHAPSPPSRTDRRPLFALAGVIILAVAVYASAAQLVTTPRVHPDEHIYGGGGASLAEGEGLTLRGEEYELGPVYPAILATVLKLSGDRETAYAFYRVANGLLFALAAIPIFLLARRLLPPWWSVGVAALSVAIPSSMYVSLVMTESASYLTYSLAVLAIVVALERASTARQLAAIGAIGLAYATRAQFAVLFAAYLLGLLVVWAIDRNRPSLRKALRGSLAVARRGRARCARSRRPPPRDGLLPARLGRRIRGSLPRLRPARHREVGPVPPGGSRALSRGGSGRGRADRPVAAVRPRAGRRCAGRGLPGRLSDGQRRDAVRHGGVREHGVRLRPTPRPQRLLPRAVVADRARRVARGRATAAARRHRRGHRARARLAGAAPVPLHRERGRRRCRAERALGPAAGVTRGRGDHRTQAARAAHPRARRGSGFPSAAVPVGIPGRRDRHVRGHGSPGLGTEDRRSRERRLRKGRRRAPGSTTACRRTRA